MRLDAVGVGRLDQRVQARTRGGASGGLTEKPVTDPPREPLTRTGTKSLRSGADVRLGSRPFFTS